MSRSIIFTDQHAPDGRTIRFNVDDPTRIAASKVEAALQQDRLVEIPNEDGGEPIFVHPDRVATITPSKEDVEYD
jgi:hypothetical protein